MPPMRILVVNAGSTSVKLRVVGPGDEIVATSDLGPPGAGLVEAVVNRRNSLAGTPT